MQICQKEFEQIVSSFFVYINLIQVARNSISKDKKYNKRKENTQIRNGLLNVKKGCNIYFVNNVSQCLVEDIEFLDNSNLTL